MTEFHILHSLCLEVGRHQLAASSILFHHIIWAYNVYGLIFKLIPVQFNLQNPKKPSSVKLYYTMSLHRTLRLAGGHVHNASYGRLGCSAIHNRTIPIPVQSSTSISPLITREPSSSRLLTTTSKKQAASNSNQNENESEDREEDSRSAIHAERSEYTRSGTDSSVASQKSSWDVAHNTPERARQASDEESERDGHGKWGPLEISPANQEVSKSTDETGRGESVVHGPSKRVSPRKGKKVTYGGQTIPSGSEHAAPKE